MAKTHHERQLDFFLSHITAHLAPKKPSSLRSWTPAPDLGNHHNLKPEREPDKTRSRLACGWQIVLS